MNENKAWARNIRECALLLLISCSLFPLLFSGCSTGTNTEKNESVSTVDVSSSAIEVSSKEVSSPENDPSGSDSSNESSTGSTFTDALDRQVTVNSHERVAALLGSYADIWMLAGGQVVATADDAWDDLHLDLAEDTVNLGSMSKLSLEKLLASNPDLVLASSKVSLHLEWQKTLEDAGIVVLYFNVSDFSDYLHLLELCTDLTGRKDLYQINGLDQQARIETLLQNQPDRSSTKILLLRCASSFVSVKNSDDTVLGKMLKALGTRNIADSDASLLENLSIESVVLQDPDMIFILPKGDDLEAIQKGVDELMSSNPLWAELSAVKNGKVYYMDKNLYSLKPNARWAEAYEKLETYFNE